MLAAKLNTFDTDCEICDFNNPKGTVSAVVIKDGNLLVLKRMGEPARGAWDLPGGFMAAGEVPQEALRRELKEELGVAAAEVDFIGWFPGTYTWKGREFAVVSSAFLVEIEGALKLDHENSEYRWLPIRELAGVAFDSDQKLLQHLKDKFVLDVVRLAALIKQLDPLVEIREINLYRSLLIGYMSKKIIDGQLVGVGWIYPRQTLLRKQAVVEDMVVDERVRGRGYGKEIILDLLRWAKDNGVEVVELTANPQRLAANELYNRVGFRVHLTNHYLLNLTDWNYDG